MKTSGDLRIMLGIEPNWKFKSKVGKIDGSCFDLREDKNNRVRRVIEINVERSRPRGGMAMAFCSVGHAFQGYIEKKF